MSYLAGNPEDRGYRDEAQIKRTKVDEEKQKYEQPTTILTMRVLRQNRANRANGPTFPRCKLSNSLKPEICSYV